MGSANRVDENEVLEIYTPDDSALVMTPCIDAAHALVEMRLTDSAVILSDELLKEIERWLAAHFCAIICRMPMREGVGGMATATIDFNNKLGFGLDNTLYGQQAKLLDVSGTLARLDAAGDEGADAGRSRFQLINPAWDGS